MSNQTQSQIFDALLDFFRQHGSGDFRHHSRLGPASIDEAPGTPPVIRQYHRPHLEPALQRPCLMTIHHDLEDNDPTLPLDRVLQRCREANLVVCLNQRQQDLLRQHGITHTAIVPHGYDDAHIQPRARVGTGSRLVLGVISRRYGRKVKGEALIQEIAKRLDPEIFTFLLIGRDRIRDAEFLLPLGFDVRCFEELPYRVLCAAYGEMDFALIASVYEGGPACLPEALASAVPVICTPVGMTPDYIRHGENGFFLSGEPARDAGLLMALARDRPRWAHMRAACAEEAARLPTWRDVVGRYEELYRVVLGRGR